MQPLQPDPGRPSKGAGWLDWISLAVWVALMVTMLAVAW